MKILCPNHNDKTPSLHVYPEFAFCFVCGYRCPSDKVATKEELETVKREPTDIGGMIEYINNLPRGEIRGLQLHFDSNGYFIVWPDISFYKKRLTNGDARYVGPRGFRAPLFKIPGTSLQNLIVVEGELNALSLAEGYNYINSGVTNGVTIVSPGSANEMLRHLNTYLTYDKVIAIVDKDIPGVVNGLKLKDEFIKRNKRIQLVTCEKDINQILQEEGKEGVAKWAKENLDL